MQLKVVVETRLHLFILEAKEMRLFLEIAILIKGISWVVENCLNSIFLKRKMNLELEQAEDEK
jgi:hypothetical protein